MLKHDYPCCCETCERSTDDMFPNDEATEDCPIKPGDHVLVSNDACDIEGEAMWAVRYPFDEIIAIREDGTGEELKITGPQADYIEINGIEYC